MSHENPPNVGERLRMLRTSHKMSLRYLAQASGLSANALSMIEHGRASPSVSTLYKLADALAIPVTAFFGQEEARQEVIHVKAQTGARVPIERGYWEGRGGEKFIGRVEPFVLSLEAGADSGPMAMVHTGHEFVYCLQGMIEYRVERKPYVLNSGDSLLFAAHLSHQWRNVGKAPAELLIMLSSFEESDHPLAVHLKNKSAGR
ncbi:MAG: cupin domain-containing protein [Chloroflexi bacterium]|nr:cupin domain-containing protein [Chloroflexota bacterium]